MPKCKKRYRDMSKYREATRRQKQRYYGKTAIYEPRTWTSYEDQTILEHDKSDMELSKMLERSVNSIQKRRYRLKHQYAS